MKSISIIIYQYINIYSIRGFDIINKYTFYINIKTLIKNLL